MAHTIEPATSGRAKCRGCGRAIEKGSLRFGERLPNPFSEGKEMTHWFHPVCAAMKRPEPLLEAIDAPDAETSREEIDVAGLKKLAEQGIAHRRLPRVDGGGRSPSGRARCRHCREAIEKDTWRVGLVYYDEGQFNPSGYIHLGCCGAYLGTTDIVDRIANFSPELSPGDLAEIDAELRTASP